jgi:hypothetical protein
MVEILHGACPEPTARPFAPLRVTGSELALSMRRDDTEKRFFNSLFLQNPRIILQFTVGWKELLRWNSRRGTATMHNKADAVTMEN